MDTMPTSLLSYQERQLNNFGENTKLSITVKKEIKWANSFNWLDVQSTKHLFSVLTFKVTLQCSANTLAESIETWEGKCKITYKLSMFANKAK